MTTQNPASQKDRCPARLIVYYAHGFRPLRFARQLGLKHRKRRRCERILKQLKSHRQSTSGPERIEVELNFEPVTLLDRLEWQVTTRPTLRFCFRGRGIALEWDQPGILQYRDRFQTKWSDLRNAASPYEVPATESEGYYRLQVP